MDSNLVTLREILGMEQLVRFMATGLTQKLFVKPDDGWVFM